MSTAQFHAELTSHLDQLSAQFALDDQGRPQLTLALSDPRLTRPYSGYYWQIDQLADSAGVRPAAGANCVRARSGTMCWPCPPTRSNDGATHRHRVMGPQGKMLGVVERSLRIDDSPDGQARTFRLMAAANEDFMLEPVARFSGMMWLALGVLAAGLMLAAVVQVLVGPGALAQPARRAGQGPSAARRSSWKGRFRWRSCR